MADGYSRQSSFADGDLIQAAHGNLEFNKLALAFAQINGHRHDGTAEGGAYVPILKDLTGTHDLTLSATGVSGSVISDDALFTADSSTLIPTQKAVKAFVEAGSFRLLTAGGVSHFTLTDAGITGTHVDDDGNLTSNSALKLITQRAVKAYVDAKDNLLGGGNTLLLSTGGVSGSVIETGVTLPTTATTTVPTTTAVKTYVDTQVEAQEVVDLAARNVIIATADTDRTTTASNLTSAVAASDALPHLNGIQDIAGSANSSVTTSATALIVTGPSVVSTSTGDNTVKTTGATGDLLLHGNRTVDIKSTVGQVNLKTLGGLIDISATGGNASLKSTNNNVVVDSVLGTTSVSSAIGTTVGTDAGTTTVSSTSGNTVVSASGTTTVSGASVVINGPISGSAIDTDVAMTANSDTVVSSQKAAKGYIDNLIATSSAPVNTASVNILDSTTALDKTSLTIDGPASATRGGRLNLQAGTTDPATADVWAQKVSGDWVLGHGVTDTHKFGTATVSLNSGTSVLTATTSVLPGYTWDTSTATVGSSTVATFTGSNTNLQNGKHTFSGTSVSLMTGDASGQVILDTTKAHFLNGKVQFSSTVTSLNNDTYTFDASKAKFLNDSAWLTTTGAKLGGGNLNLTATQFDVLNNNLSVAIVGGDTRISKNVGVGELVLKNTLSNVGITLQANKAGTVQDTIRAVGSASGSYAQLNFNSTNRLNTQVNGITLVGNLGATMGFIHNGSNAFWDNETSGDLFVRNLVTSKNITLEVKNSSGVSQSGVVLVGDSVRSYTRLYENSAERLRTLSDGVNIFGSSGNSLSLGHDGTNGFLNNIDSGHLYLRNQVTNRDIIIQVDDTLGVGHDVIRMRGSAAPNVDLFYDDSTRLSTTALGVDVSNGAYKMSVEKVANGDGTLVNFNSGDLILKNDVSDKGVLIQARSSIGALQDTIIAKESGVVIKHTGVTRLSTTSNGIVLTGSSNKQASWNHNGSDMHLVNPTQGALKIQNEAVGQSVDLKATRTDGTLYTGLSVGGTTNLSVKAFFDDRNVLRTTATGIDIGWSGFGTVQIGPQNTTFCHFTTDRPAYLFNKDINVTGKVIGSSGNWGILDNIITLGSGREVLKDTVNGFVSIGEGFANGIHTTRNFRTDASLQVGVSGASWIADSTGMRVLGTSGLNVTATTMTFKDLDVVNEKSIDVPAGTITISNDAARLYQITTWTGAYTFNIDPIATLTIGSSIVIHKNNSDSTFTINLTGAGNIALYGPWNGADSQITVPIGTSGDITFKVASATVIKVTLNLTNHN